MDRQVLKAISEHPCYDVDAHTKFARMHLPVAPRCNIQCNYCNRKYDCSNESRPGVTSEVLTPEQAVAKIGEVLEKILELKVIGIAGPGDPMANESTFKTIELVAERFPDLTLCISTNGLGLPGNVKRLHDLGVRFVTITMNALDPEIGAKVYDHIMFEGRRIEGREAAEILIGRQKQGLDEAVEMGMVVKINIVMIPGINDSHIPELARYVKSKGAYSVNILPLIPVEGTRFSDMEPPSPQMRKRLMDQCEGLGIRIMRHCKQCRADAIGLLDKDRSSEFADCGSCRYPSKITIDAREKNNSVAVASDNGVEINCGFGNAQSFYVYNMTQNHKLLEVVRIDTDFKVTGFDHKEHIAQTVKALGGVSKVVITEIGPFPEKLMREAGIEIIIAKGNILDVLADL